MTPQEKVKIKIIVIIAKKQIVNKNILGKRDTFGERGDNFSGTRSRMVSLVVTPPLPSKPDTDL